MKPLPSGNVESLVRTGDHIEKHGHTLCGSFYLHHRKGTMMMRIKTCNKKKNMIYLLFKRKLCFKTRKPLRKPDFYQTGQKIRSSLIAYLPCCPAKTLY
jgi:hypothetical protein